MVRKFQPSVILHIEDNDTYRRAFALDLMASDEICGSYGHLKKVVSLIASELDQQGLIQELERLERETGVSPTLLQVTSGQVARNYLERCLPSCVITYL